MGVFAMDAEWWKCPNCGAGNGAQFDTCRNCGKSKIDDEKLSPPLVDAVLTSAEPLQPGSLHVDSYERPGSPNNDDDRRAKLWAQFVVAIILIMIGGVCFFLGASAGFGIPTGIDTVDRIAGDGSLLFMFSFFIGGAGGLWAFIILVIFARRS